MAVGPFGLVLVVRPFVAVAVAGGGLLVGRLGGSSLPGLAIVRAAGAAATAATAPATPPPATTLGGLLVGVVRVVAVVGLVLGVLDVVGVLDAGGPKGVLELVDVGVRGVVGTGRAGKPGVGSGSSTGCAVRPCC